MKKLFSIIFIMLMVVPAFAQQEPQICQSDEQMRIFYKNHPQALKMARDYERSVRQKSQINRSADGSYTIPVVFHVFGTDFAGESVTDEIITTAVNKVNEDFKGNNDDFSTVSPLFKDLRGTLDIEFKLAKIDPNGNPSTGINYYAERSGFGNGSGYDDQIKQFAWDNYKYMNVYIMLDLYGDQTYNNSGVAWYPDAWMSDNNLSRVVYNGRYLYGNTDKEFASVLTHEFGHWLNLAHTFDNGCDAPGDKVDDTPATTANSGVCNVTTEKCPGAGIPNGENYMDYSTCYKMFTLGQIARMTAALDHPTRQPLWQPENLEATGVNNEAEPFLRYSASTLYEDDDNEGGIAGAVNIIAVNGAGFAASGLLTQGTHYTIGNLPQGLTVKIEVTSNTTAVLSITGQALAHAEANSIANISIQFLDAAITGGTAAIANPTYNGFKISFKDPYQIVYNDIEDITVNSTNDWQWFSVDYGDGNFGCWYDEGNLRIETYLKPLVCVGTSRNASLLTEGTPITSSSNWIEGGPYPDEHNLRTNSYQVWDGKTGYVGFQFSSPDGKILHGWFRITVSANGGSFTLKDYAYNTKPQGTILAGATDDQQLPVAKFYASDSTITTDGTVAFLDASEGNPTTWIWSFPGGTPSSSQEKNPVITYTTAGVYDVSLTVTNGNGSNSKTVSQMITVRDAAQQYCPSAGQNASYEYISSVQIGSFSNNSGTGVYSDFTQLNVALTTGDNTVKLSPGFAGSAYREYFKIWVDFNQDGDFEDAGELAYDQGTASKNPAEGKLVVPATAKQGSTRLRVSMRYNKPPLSCGSFDYGEVEDYTAVITPPVAEYCEPIAGNPAGQYIREVKIDGYENVSSYASGYDDYSQQLVVVTTGTTLEITPQSSWTGTKVGAWVDWNRNGTFENDEQVMSAQGATPVYTSNLAIPAGMSGAYRLRVRIAYSDTPQPCGELYFSEAEDYTINIKDQQPMVMQRNNDPIQEVMVYPNPAQNNQFNLKYASSTDVIITLTDMKGSVIHSAILKVDASYYHNKSITISQRLKGLYILQVKNEVSIETQKILFE